MKKLLSILALVLSAPATIALAALPIPTGLDSIPSEGKYLAPCAQGDLYVSGTCVYRRFADAFRQESILRRQERIISTQETRRSQAEDVRNVYLHPTGVRASKSNGFELLEPNSRQYKRAETLVQFNLRALRAKQRNEGPVTTRVDLTPNASATTRTKKDRFWNPANLRVRRGLRL